MAGHAPGGKGRSAGDPPAGLGSGALALSSGDPSAGLGSGASDPALRGRLVIKYVA